MRYKHRTVVLVAVAVLLAAGEAAAQRGRFNFGRPTGPVSLITLAANEAVQKDLGVAEVDARKLRELNDEYRRAVDRAAGGREFDFQTLRELSEDERRIVLAELAAQREEGAAKVNGEFEARLATIISPEEIGRLKQIRLQSQGAEALYEPDVAQKLELSEEQNAKLAEIRREAESRGRGGFGQGRRGDPGAGGQDAFARLREQAEQREIKTLEVLTAEQKQKLEELKGYPFDVSQIRTGFGRRGN